MKRFVIGDIHGAHHALIQCFERSGFNRKEDLLICLGDLCDGWPDVHKVFDELLEIRNLVLILGNHDQWLLKWFITGEAPDTWMAQGGDVTINAYKIGPPAAHVNLLKSARLYYILNNYLFVHGGFLPGSPLELQGADILLWDRTLVKAALLHRQQGEEVKLTRFKRVYVGHTPTTNFGESKPISSCGVTIMDTGAGWSRGLLTMMDLDDKKTSQSDPVDQLYPEFRGRK
jgi:serine/threonine protein phosphatase 1